MQICEIHLSSQCDLPGFNSNRSYDAAGDIQTLDAVRCVAGLDDALFLAGGLYSAQINRAGQ
jgi:hypothetical protein